MRCQRVLAEFRRDYGRVLGDPRVAGVLAWLRENSAEFRAAWDQQSVLAREGACDHSSTLRMARCASPSTRWPKSSAAIFDWWCSSR
jgi:hypothetical protein